MGDQDVVQVGSHVVRLTSRWTSDHAEMSERKLDRDLLLSGLRDNSLKHPGLVAPVESIPSISQQGHYFSTLGPTQQGLRGQIHGALHIGESDKARVGGGHTCQASDLCIL